MSEKKRIVWLDYLRTIAILCVLLCHSVEGIYHFNVKELMRMGYYSQIIAFTCFTIGRLGAPLFFLISGYLLLDRDYSDGKAVSFWKNNWLRLLTCTSTWFIIYDLFLKFVLKRNVPWIMVLMDAIYLHKVDMGHVWYMPVILAIYVCVPLLAYGLRKFETSTLKFPYLFFMGCAFVIPFANIINNILFGKTVALQIPTMFSGGAYGIYFLTGYMLRKGSLKKYSTSLMISISALSFAAAVMLQLWAYSRGYQYNIWYDNILLLICSTCVFEMVSRVKSEAFSKSAQFISRYSFAMYLIHYPFRMLLIRYFSTVSGPHAVRMMIVWALSFVISITVSWLISKIPKVGPWLLFLK